MICLPCLLNLQVSPSRITFVPVRISPALLKAQAPIPEATAYVPTVPTVMAALTTAPVAPMLAVTRALYYTYAFLL